jgi:hypothetical protein
MPTAFTGARSSQEVILSSDALLVEGGENVPVRCFHLTDAHHPWSSPSED